MAVPRISVAVPTVASPMTSETVSVGVALPEVSFTFTVNVTGRPTYVGYDEDVTVVVVGAVWIAGISATWPFPLPMLPRSATNTSPALSTATSTGWMKPLPSIDGVPVPGLPFEAGRSTTFPAPELATNRSPEELTATPCGSRTRSPTRAGPPGLG